MLRIREAESTQTFGDLRQKIAELEVQVNSSHHQIHIFIFHFHLESRINNSWSNHG